MAEVKWIKLFVDIWDNRKIKQIETLPDGDTVLVIWLKLLTLAGNINNDGFVYFTKDIPFSDEMLAAHFGKPLNTVKMALEVFQRFGMIEIVNDIIHVSNWEKYQNIEGMERTRELTRQRVAKYRERQQIECKNDVTLRNVTVTRQKEERRKKKEDEEIMSVARFRAPTHDEISSYCLEKGIRIDVDRFIDYYTANGWKVGRNPMKDWKATVRNWSRQDKGKPTFTADEMETADVDLDAMKERMFKNV